MYIFCTNFVVKFYILFLTYFITQKLYIQEFCSVEVCLSTEYVGKHLRFLYWLKALPNTVVFMKHQVWSICKYHFPCCLGHLLLLSFSISWHNDFQSFIVFCKCFQNSVALSACIKYIPYWDHPLCDDIIINLLMAKAISAIIFIQRILTISLSFTLTSNLP